MQVIRILHSLGLLHLKSKVLFIVLIIIRFHIQIFLAVLIITSDCTVRVETGSALAFGKTLVVCHLVGLVCEHVTHLFLLFVNLDLDLSSKFLLLEAIEVADYLKSRL